MSNPAVMSMNTEWEWVKIATAITVGSIHMVNRWPCYYRTYRLTGESAPSSLTPGTIPDEAIQIFIDATEEIINANEAIDVYLFCKNDNSKITAGGKVVIDA